jgi:hypothetical protein
MTRLCLATGVVILEASSLASGVEPPSPGAATEALQERIAPHHAQLGPSARRGLITLEGVTGMYLNPTSSTLPRQALSLGFCDSLLEQDDDIELQHTAMLAYGLTEALEVGLTGRVSDLDNDDQRVAAGGPFLRCRLIEEVPDRCWPELSAGFVARLGHTDLDRKTLFVAASKRMPLDPEGLLKSFRAHLGMRCLWQGGGDNGAIVYIGGELELPHRFFVVAEGSTRDDLSARTPFAIGVQWRPASPIGLSVAGVQAGEADHVGLYVGIGIDY